MVYNCTQLAFPGILQLRDEQCGLNGSHRLSNPRVISAIQIRRHDYAPEVMRLAEYWTLPTRPVL